MKETKYLVAIRCMTYNQSSYINDALNGFVMQETSFPFVAVVVDDASTDGEQEVIFEYVNKHFNDSQESGFKEWETEEAFWTFAQHRENKNCHFVVAYLKKNLYGNPKKLELIKEWCNTKYIAVCEGDDYWTDDLKLQRQVDFLETNVEYSASAENGLIFYTSSQTTDVFSNESTKDVTFEELLIKRRFPTASVMYRACYCKGIESLVPPRFDTLVWAYLAKQGKIHYNQVISSVYRRGCGITSHDKIKWAYTVRSYNISLNKNFYIPDEIARIRKRDVFENLIKGLREAKRQKRYADVFKLFSYGVQLSPKRMFKLLVKKGR